MRTEKLIVTTLLSVNFVFGGWQYQKTISISNTNELLQNYQVFVELTPTNFQYDHCLGTRGSDIRFSTNPYGSISPDIPHWIQDWNNNDTSSIWINVPNIAADSTTDIYMYYGGNDTISTSNGKSTFEVFEDFIFDNGEWIENDPNSRILLDYSGDERLEFNAWERSDPGAVYKSYSPPASFVFEYDFNMTDGWGNRNSPGPMFGDQLGSFTDQQNCIFISYWIGSAQPRVQFKYKVDGAHTQVGEIFISETIQYYGRITKKTAGDNIQLVYELFSDSDRQNHVSGSPLNTYYQSNGINTDYMFLVNTGSWNNSDTENSTGWMDNYIIKKTAASDPNVAVSTTETEGFWTLESSGLIAYYPFNNSPSDESGNGNDGDIIGAIITTDRFDNDNSAYSFTNSIETDQNRIQVSGPNGFLGGDPFTSLAFAAWFKAPIQTDNCSYILRIASSDGTCYLSYEDNGSVAFNLRKTQDGTLNQVLYASAIPDRWHFVVGNWDGQIQEIYLDWRFRSIRTVIPELLVQFD